MTSTESLPDSAAEVEAGVDVTGSMRASASWLAGSKVFQLAFRMLTSLVLARLLAPRDFGLLGLVGVLMVFLQRTVAESGTSHALIQRREVTGRLASTVFWFNMVVGGTITAAFLAAAPELSVILGEPEAKNVIRGMAATFLFGALVKVPQALLRREMRFGAIAGLGLVNALITGGVAIPLAAMGHGVASVVIGQVAATVVEAVLTFVVARWRPTAGFHRDELRLVNGFARNLTVFNVVAYIADAGDKFMVGRFVGTTALGIYNLPYRLLFAPITALAQVVREIFLPRFSRRQDETDAIGDEFLRGVGALALVTFPLCAITSALAQPLVDTALGPKWQEAGPILSVMAVVALLQSILNTGSVLLTARGRTDVLLRWGLVAGVTNLVAYLIGVQWGVMGMATAFLVVTIVLAYPAMALPFREIETPVRRLAAPLWRVTVATVLLAALAVGARIAAEQAGLHHAAVLLLGTAAGSVGFGLGLLWLRPAALDDLLGPVLTRLGRARRGRTPRATTRTH